MNGQRWRLTPEEVQVVWPLTGVSRLPFPFDVRPTAATVDEQRAVDAAARARLATGHVLAGGRLDPDLHSALLVLVRPRAALDAVGFLGDRPSDLVRILAARSGTSGVLAVQLPGLAEDAGGDLLGQTVPAAGLPAAPVRALPPAPPGRSGAVRVGPTGASAACAGSTGRATADTCCATTPT
ncbi:ESX secretion-associated protein EspG [Rhodococcus antarcticus]|uniref:ESX secretion-associated protein EspG n=1 Tax=Rhodococcus antarcticus TaxID=2987751 RepID=A0ABY6NZZ8_9NOCA|nr:ESX secretion-associated protein EspG [Rhodococcus antarcticus]UZJ24596.1 ESX secretion-associated protein EspG [Rhodococcus antarcticus]